jgi:hypothetical protein
MRTRHLALTAVSLALLVACGGGGADDSCKTNPNKCVVVGANQPPKASLKGPAAVKPGTAVTLDASGSSDADGDAAQLRFLWSEDGNNPPNNFLNGVDLTASKITFTPDQTGTFVYQVRVKDAAGDADTAEFTLAVTADAPTVTPNTAPQATSLTINGVVFPLPGSPTAFTTATGTLDVSIQGTDAEDAAASLVQVFSANVSGTTAGPGKRYWVASQYAAARDDDGFARASFTVKLVDSGGAAAGPYTVNVRIVPGAKANLTPRAVFVNCGVASDGTGLTAASPRKTLQGGYDAAVANAIQDVWVAAGTCAGAQVDFAAGVRLWGLFDPLDWHRHTEAADRAADKLAGAGHKFAGATRTVVRDPSATRLVYTAGTGSASGSLKLDGFSFDLGGSNFYAVSLTTPTADTVRIELTNNEFVGAVQAWGTQVANFWVPGGVLVYRGQSSAGDTYLDRNFFAVDSQGGLSHMQAWVDSAVRTLSTTGAIHFYGNVFTGTVAAEPYYYCNRASSNTAPVPLKNPFAFCLYAFDQGRVYAARNTIWAQAITDQSGGIAVNPVAVSAGMGKLLSFGNVFSSAGSPYKITFAHNSANTSSPMLYGAYFFNAYPSSGVSGYLFLTNYSTGKTGIFSATGYSCLAGGSFGNGSPCTLDANLKPSAIVYYASSNNSFLYDPATLALGANQPWRLSHTAFKDLFLHTDLNFNNGAGSENLMQPHPEAYFDFDGVYGPLDSTSLGTAKFNAGAFEQ